MKKIFQILLLGLLIYFIFVPRSVEVFNKNYLFGFDQGRDYLAVKNIVVNHKPTLIGSEIGAGAAGFRGIFQGPFHYYFLAIPFLLFRGDPYGGLLLMFLFGLASIIFTYFFVKKLFGQNIALITAILVAACPSLIPQSRFIWNSHPSTLFILLSFYFIFLINNKINKHIFLAAFFTGFIYNFEIAIAVPMSLALFLYAVFILRCKFWKKYLFLFSGFIVSFLPLLLFDLRHGLSATRGIIEYLFLHKGLETTLLLPPRLLEDHLFSFYYNLLNTFPPFYYNFLNLFSSQNIIPTVLPLLFIIILAVYFFIKEKNKALKYFLGFLLMLPFVNFFVFNFLRDAVYQYYLIDLNLVYILLFAYCFYKIFQSNNLLLKFSISVFLLIIIISGATKYFEIFKYDYYDYGGTAKINGEKDALDYIYRDANGEKFGLLIFSPPIYTYQWDYLLWWYAENKYKYIPTSK